MNSVTIEEEKNQKIKKKKGAKLKLKKPKFKKISRKYLKMSKFYFLTIFLLVSTLLTIFSYVSIKEIGVKNIFIENKEIFIILGISLLVYYIGKGLKDWQFVMGLLLCAVIYFAYKEIIEDRTFFYLLLSSVPFISAIATMLYFSKPKEKEEKETEEKFKLDEKASI